MKTIELNVQEMSINEMCEVNGGINWSVILSGAAVVVCAAVPGVNVIEAGLALGTFIYECAKSDSEK